MATKLEEVLEILKLQRSILKDGGYEPSVRTPRKEERIFRDSVTCLHSGEAARKGPCDECVLAEFVPAEYANEEYPCHHIPLNERGDTIHSLEAAGDREKAASTLLAWLDSVISNIELQIQAAMLRIA